MNLRFYFFELWGLIVDHGLPLIAFVIIGILLPRMGRLAIRIIEHNLDEQEEATKARLALTGALVYIVQAVAYFLLVAAALTNLGVPALGAAVPATIVSAAVGFGAQSVISDFLSGFFILTEKQFGVGDYVSFAGIPGVEGDVVMLTLRTTKVRTPTGELVIIPNSSAGVVTNYSKEWSRAVVNINVPVHEGETLPEITRRVKEISEQAIQSPEISVDVAGELTVLPATQLVTPQVAGQPWQVGYRVMVTVNPARQWSVERAIRSALLSEFWDHYGSAIDFDELQELKKKKPTAAKHAAAQSTQDAFIAGEGARSNTPVDDPTADQELVPEEVELAETKLEKQAVTDDRGEDGPDETEESRRKIWRTIQTNTQFQKIATIGGRVRASTTGLMAALLVVGLLILAASNPENGEAGWLSPAYWKDRDTQSSSAEPTESEETVPTDAPLTTGTPTEPADADSTPTTTNTATVPSQPSQEPISTPNSGDGHGSNQDGPAASNGDSGDAQGDGDGAQGADGNSGVSE
ncbi:mechanosensitive ion channel [Corynebacterium macginleyi]|uniref:Mechanosensitive ion channel family protein n=1 Tax=Corynebacterium macginleyi TaxID=38290 RepID=A0A3M0GHZ2_9CORY|nr:mechanosensitive ion channel family protein [Corynebacterium macginleyi]MBK4156815.1 mechanosensitive ion channel [Corynebacterium macginleyi]RMB60689.1 mechanosensitive ion channel family protein [Corynebacterium macginleyi]